MDSYSSSSSSSSSPTITPSPKRKAGRKKFRETRHPVYRGVRQRGCRGKWVCEVREPNKKSRIWLGTYPTPEMAARAHDVAAIALRGKAAQLNFPESAWALPRAESAMPEDIRRAVARVREAEVAVVGPEEVREVVEEEGFVDEEAVFDMPGLLRDMAEGMMLTPPGMMPAEEIEWEGLETECYMDMTLWSM